MLPHDSLTGDSSLPPKVRSVLEARLAQVSPAARELAGLAATIGREFSFRLLARASGCDEDTLVRQLDELWQRRIVREHGADAYDFGHDKLREVAYTGVSAARRRLLHLQAARALEALHASELDPVSPQLAAHYERAGRPGQAVPYYLRAAKVARRVYANQEAIALLRRGLALAEEERASTLKDQPGSEVIAHLCEDLGDVLELTAQHEAALEAYQRAQAQVPRADRIWQARLHRRAGTVLCEQRLYAQALAACNQAETVLGQASEAEDAAWWDEWLEVQAERVWAHYWLAQWPEMDALVKQVEPVVRGRAGAASRMRFLEVSCLMHLRKHRYVVSDEMLASSREQFALGQERGDLNSRVNSGFELGFLHLWRRELDEAQRHLSAALELAEIGGILPFRTLILTYLTVLNRFRGQVEGVRDCASRARQAAETAHMPDYVAAAEGNAAWVAWRERDLLAAEKRAQEALTIWRQSPLVYPFQWQALWPLMAVALEQGHDEQAWAHAQALLEPAQQRLPDALHSALEAALQAKAQHRAEAALQHLHRAMHLAGEMGYL